MKPVERVDAIWPQVIAAVITKNADQVNLAPINFLAVSTKYEAPISLVVGLGNQSFTRETVLETKEFVLAYPNRDQLADIIHCGTVSGRSGDKFAGTNLKFTPSDQVAPSYLNEAVANCECRVVHSYDAGTFTIVIAHVVATHESGKGNLDKIYALGDTNYGAITATEILQSGR